MKKVLSFLILLTFLSVGNLFSQSEVMEVQWQDANGDFIINSLVDVITADRDGEGNQLHTYKVQMGGFYLVDQPLETTKSLTIFADAHDRMNGTVAPPTIYPVGDIDAGASTITTAIFEAGADITLKNIYIAGEGDSELPLGGANIIRQVAHDITITLDGVIMDYPGFSAIWNNGDFKGMSLKCYNSELRNSTFIFDQWVPFWVFSTQPVNQIIFNNCTAMNNQGLLIQMRVPINYLEIDHCTFANIGKELLFNESLTNAKITNNIFYNTFAMGGNAAEDADKDHDGLPWGTVNLDVLFGNNEGDSTTASMPESDRVVIVQNNVFYQEQEFVDFYGDSLSPAMWMNERTQTMFDDDANYPGLVDENNVTADPSFANIDNTGLMTYITSNRQQGTLVYWGWEPDSDRVTVDWPLPEDLSHSLSMMGTDGLPIGDLNWTGMLIGVEKNSGVVPNGFELAQNYPNPFNPSTVINFSIPLKGTVNLSVFNLLGQKVTELVNEELSAGSYNFSFDASSLSSGIYVYSIQVNDFVETKKMMLLK